MLKRSLICCSLGVSVSYCLATDGSVWELTSLDLSCSGILKRDVAENCLGWLILRGAFDKEVRGKRVYEREMQADRRATLAVFMAAM